MKKLMFAVAAIAAGVAVADLTSSNIVGYSQSGLCNGATMTTPQFVPVNGDEAINLQDISAAGEDINYTVFLSTLNPNGGKIATYMWDGATWLDAATLMPAEGVSIQQGTALWAEGQNANQAIRSAGQVPVKDAEIQLCNGATMAGNFTPVAIDIQDILVQGEGVAYCVFISKLNANGGKVATYMWDGSQWLDASTLMRAEDVAFAAGEGMWVEGQSTSQSIVIPGVEL